MSPSKPPETQRIAKLLARAGIASRREIERMIAEGRIALDGKVLDTPATLLTSLHGVTVDGNPVAAPAPARLFRYHKPAGLLTTEHDPAGRPTIVPRQTACYTCLDLRRRTHETDLDGYLAFRAQMVARAPAADAGRL
mgnify:CR=1 FL=1